MRKNWKIKKKNSYKKVVQKNIREIEQSRNGGQVALIGYDYQCLFSCYTLLDFLDDNDKRVRLEGTEDIDNYSCKTKENSVIQHIQLKASKNTQDASFLKSVLKNYLEAYLCEPNNHEFLLVYDFKIAEGNLKKIINKNLDKNSKEYWESIIKDIKKENKNWLWERFNFDKFINCLKFKHYKRSDLEFDITRKLIDKYEINTGNETIFINGLYYLCFSKMKNRGEISLSELNIFIQSIKDDISKGAVNPTYKWIEYIDFNELPKQITNFEYYNGKKADQYDILNGLPVRRENVEREIEDSIKNNVITVIKASSGQGKTTLALQVAYNLRSEYKIYKLLWCKDTREIDSIVEYFKSRIKLGEKPFIILDNLDVELEYWNILAQRLYNNIGTNYKLVLTTREDDWYLYAGDQSTIKSIRIVNLYLDKNQAEKIFQKLKMVGKLDPSITNWQSAWEQVADKKLLIEYVYLLTHGTMLSERITEQIKNLQKQDNNAGIKCEILRKVCLADTLGIKLSSDKLVNNLKQTTTSDIPEIIKSLESEFYIKYSQENIYLEGLHPVRSKHIVERLHESITIKDTMVNLLDIIDKKNVSKLYSYFPEIIKTDKDDFYKSLITRTSKFGYEYLYNSLQGIFSGSVMAYYKQNKNIFNDADEHFGLLLLITSTNPFKNFEEINKEINPLKSIYEMSLDNKNIKYLYNLSEAIEKIELENTDAYIYSKYVFENLNSNLAYKDLTALTNIIIWLFYLNPVFNLLNNVSFKDIWNNAQSWGIKNIANLMYCWSLADKENNIKFIENNKKKIFHYLKRSTNSIKLYENKNKSEIYVEYILLPENIGNANTESVDRINLICKTLPIYKTYCSQAIKPQIDVLNFNLPDDSHKEMPIENIVIGFRIMFTELWSDTILSNYEFASTFEWIEHWKKIREKTIQFLQKNNNLLERRINKQKINPEIWDTLEELRTYISTNLGKVKYYPHEKRVFEKNQPLPKGVEKIKNIYFHLISNYMNQIDRVLLRNDENKIRLAMCNLKDAKSQLQDMQNLFNNIISETQNFSYDTEVLCKKETEIIDYLLKLNEFYIEFGQTKFYTSNILKQWNIDKQKIIINSIIEKIKIANATKFDFIYPEKLLEEGIITKLPLIIKNVNLDEQNLNMLISILSTIENDQIQYVILLFNDSDKNIKQNGLSVSNNYLNAVNKFFKEEDPSILENIIPPLPTEINQNILNCFNDDYSIKKSIVNDIGGVDIILLTLWEYSQYKKYLNTKEDEEYLLSTQINKKKEIYKVWDKIKSAVPKQFIDKINELKDAVLIYDYLLKDSELNEILNELVRHLVQVNK